MKVTVIHSHQERCGVREYGLQLDRSLQHAGVEIKAHSYNDLGVAFDHTQNGGVILVHFEAGLADPGRLSFYGRCARARGVRIVFCCHWYEDGYMRTNYEGCVDRFVVHRGYPSSVLPMTIIPLGCPTYEPSNSRFELRRKFGYDSHDVVMTTIGFLTAWKRLPEVARSMLEEMGRMYPSPLRLHFQTPWPYYQANAADLEADIRRTMANVAGGVAMTLSTTFLPEQETLDLAHASDVGFVFHGIHTNSVSAATKQFVSARTPLVVTNSSHASDIDGLERVDTFDMGTFCRAVTGLALDAPKREMMRGRMEREYERLNMNATAEKYIALFKELGAS